MNKQKHKDNKMEQNKVVTEIYNRANLLVRLNELARTKIIDTNSIVFDEGTRNKCAENLCGNFGKNLMCPPSIKEVKEYENISKNYSVALLVQSESDCSMFTTYNEEAEKFVREQSIKLHNSLVHLETRAKSQGLENALACVGGSCKLCDKCAGFEGKPCVNPDMARPSMEAMGIDVIKTCNNNDFPSDFKKGRLLLTGIIYLA